MNRRRALVASDRANQFRNQARRRCLNSERWDSWTSRRVPGPVDGVVRVVPECRFRRNRAVRTLFADVYPGFVPGKPDSGAPIWRLSDALYELLGRLADLEYVPDLLGPPAMAAFGGLPEDRDLRPLLGAAPRLEGLVRLLAQLLDTEPQVPDGTRFGGSVTSASMELGRRPDRPGRQSQLGAVG